jgi:hypothetical protein
MEKNIVSNRDNNLMSIQEIPLILSLFFGLFIESASLLKVKSCCIKPHSARHGSSKLEVADLLPLD